MNETIWIISSDSNEILFFMVEGWHRGLDKCCPMGGGSWEKLFTIPTMIFAASEILTGVSNWIVIPLVLLLVIVGWSLIWAMHEDLTGNDAKREADRGEEWWRREGRFIKGKRREK